MRLNLAWSDVYPLWIETRGGKFFTTTYDDRDNSMSWAYIVAEYTSGLVKGPECQIYRLYPFWDSAPRCRDIILGVWDNYQEAKDYLLGTQDELCYIAGCWILGLSDRVVHEIPEIKEGRPDRL